MNYSTALALVNTIQSKDPALSHASRAAPGPQSAGCGSSAPGWLSAPSSSSISTELARLFARSGDDDAAAEQRAIVEPAEMLAQSRRRRRPRAARADPSAACDVGDRPDRARHRLLRRRGAVVDQRGGFVRRAAVREERLRDRRNLPRAGVADDRPARSRRRGPVHVARRVSLGFVAAHDQRVTRLGIRDRHPGIGGAGNRQRNAGHDLEGNALLVQEDRFLAAAVEHERIAPLQPHHRPAFARLLREQVGDCILVERLGGGRADVDPLRRRRALAASSRASHAMVVDDDLRRGAGSRGPAR